MAESKPQYLRDFTPLRDKINDFNKIYKSQFKRLTRKRALEIIEANQIQVFSFTAARGSRDKLFVLKSLDFSIYIVQDLLPC